MDYLISLCWDYENMMHWFQKWLILLIIGGRKSIVCHGWQWNKITFKKSNIVRAPLRGQPKFRLWIMGNQRELPVRDRISRALEKCPAKGTPTPPPTWVLWGLQWSLIPVSRIFIAHMKVNFKIVQKRFYCWTKQLNMILFTIHKSIVLVLLATYVRT